MSKVTQWYQPTVVPVETIELVILQLGEVRCGLPIARIDRIINHTANNEPIDRSPDVEILDLHHQLFGVSHVSPGAYAIVRGDRQLYSIPVDIVPTLATVEIDLIRRIPTELVAHTPLNIATHIAMRSDESPALPIFMLNI